MTAHSPSRTRHGLLGLAVRGLTTAGLAVEAVIHLQLAPVYQLAAPSGIGQGNLFRVEAAAALLSAVYVLLRGSRMSYAVAFVVAAGGLAAVLLYRYVDVPGFGPIPSMYEPLWFTKKAVTAIAETMATLTAVIGLARSWQSDATG